MNRSTIPAGVLALFVLGVLVGAFVPSRGASAQDEVQDQQNAWVIEAC